MMNARDRTTLSKLLSKILRHRALDEGLDLRPDGYISILALLALPKLKKLKATLEDIKEVVNSDQKSRFTMKQEEKDEKEENGGGGGYWIRANQGHSLDLPDLELSPILDAKSFPVVIHGTSLKAWQSIKSQGLNPMSRTFIHFSTGKHGDPNVISGIRKSCEVFVYIDLEKCLGDGIAFWRSSNGVLLSAGKNGILSPEYFSKVESTVSAFDDSIHLPTTKLDELAITETGKVDADDKATESDEQSVQMTRKLLFGGTIRTCIPRNFIDASEIRQIPDSQEVFLDPDSETTCFIVELTESLVHFSGKESAIEQFNSLAEEDSTECSISFIEALESEKGQVRWLVQGVQTVRKFNRDVAERVIVTLGMIRISKVTTDVLLAYYQSPRLQSTQSNHDNEAMKREGRRVVRKAVEGFEVLEWGLFPETEQHEET